MASTPNGTTAQFATAFAAPLSVTAASNATSAVLTVTNTLTVGDFVEVSSEGWQLLDKTVCRVSVASGTSVTLDSVDTTSTTLFPAAGQGVTTIRKINTWASIPDGFTIEGTGGEIKKVTQPVVTKGIDLLILDGETPIEYAIGIDADQYKAAYFTSLLGLSKANTITALRLTTKQSGSILISATVFMQEMPSMAAGAAMANKATFMARGRVVRV